MRAHTTAGTARKLLVAGGLAVVLFAAGVGASVALSAGETTATATFTNVVTYTIPTVTQTVTVTATAPTTTTAPPPPASALTGAHWPNTNEYQTLKNVGYGFAISTVNPGDLVTAAAKLNAAKAAGIKLIIGVYPEPYTLSGGQWSISPAGVQTLDYFETRQPDILALFVYNEPYQCGTGGYSAADLRSLRTKIKTVWAGAKIYHDLGWPSSWAANDFGCAPGKYTDQTGVADYAGIWDYPFEAGGYQKTRALARLSRETSYVTNQMGAIPVWLNQSHSYPALGLVWPTQAQILDWNCATRAALPAGGLISWYVWRQAIYPNFLANYPAYWPSTVAAAC